MTTESTPTLAELLGQVKGRLAGLAAPELDTVLEVACAAAKNAAAAHRAAADLIKAVELQKAMLIGRRQFRHRLASRIERDAVVKAFVERRYRSCTIDQCRDEAVARFGDRAPSRTAIGVHWQKMDRRRIMEGRT